MESAIISRKEAAAILGVSTQTVSNYISRGLLQQAKISSRQACFVYLDEVKYLIGRARDIEQMEACIDSYKKELADKQMELKHAIALFDFEISFRNKGFLYKKYIQDTILACTSQMGASEQTKSVMRMFINGSSLQEIGKEYGVGVRRVRQIISATIRALKYRAGEYSRMKNAYLELKRHIFLLEAENQKLREQIQRYEKELEIKNNPDVSVWNGIDLATKLEDFDLSIRSLNGLKAAGINTLWELATQKSSDMLNFRNLGKKCLLELDELLKSVGLHWGMKIRIEKGIFVVEKDYQSADLNGNIEKKIRNNIINRFKRHDRT